MYIVLKHFAIYYCYITFQCNNLDLCKTTHFGVQTEAAQVSDNFSNIQDLQLAGWPNHRNPNYSDMSHVFF